MPSVSFTSPPATPRKDFFPIKLKVQGEKFHCKNVISRRSLWLQLGRLLDARCSHQASIMICRTLLLFPPPPTTWVSPYTTHSGSGLPSPRATSSLHPHLTGARHSARSISCLGAIRAPGGLRGALVRSPKVAQGGGPESARLLHNGIILEVILVGRFSSSLYTVLRK